MVLPKVLSPFSTFPLGFGLLARMVLLLPYGNLLKEAHCTKETWCHKGIDVVILNS